MAANMLKELPSFNKENFSKFKVDDNMKSNLRAATYIQTKDLEEEKPQVIVTDKTNILLRYLRQQLTVKEALMCQRRRDKDSLVGKPLSENLFKSFFEFISKVGSRTLATSRTKLLATVVEDRKPLTNVSKSSIQDIAEALNIPQNKQSKRTVDSSTDSTPQAKHARVDFEENEND